MIGVALKGLLGRKLRSTLTAFAVVLGVAMVSGSFVLTDTIRVSFEGVFEDSHGDAAVVVTSKQAVSTATDADAARPPFSASLLGKIERVRGAGSAVGSVFGTLRLVGADGKPLGRDGTGLSVDRSDDQGLNPLTLVGGRWPRGRTEIAIDESTAEKEGLHVGDMIGAFADGPVRRYRITALIRLGSSGSVAGTTLAALDLPTAQRLFHKLGKLDEIHVAAAGVSADALARRIRSVLPPTAQARTASAQAAADSRDMSDELSVFRYVLLAFGGIALFVGGFVIANTLSITVAQRMRELATVRTLGGSRRQVLSSVLLEAAVIGVVASTAGLFLGLGVARSLRSLLAAIDLELPSSSLVFAPRTVVLSLLVGTVVTLLASLRPAVRATRVPPIAAVREGAVLPPSRLARRGPIASAVVLAVAAALLGAGLLADGVALRLRLLSLGAGVLILFLGVALVAPRLVRPLAAVLGAPGARLAGATGSLARANATRHPGRTATTAAALMIGLALITFVAVLAQGARASFIDAVDEQFLGNYALAGGDAGVGDAALRAAARVPDVETVSGVKEGSGRLFGQSVLVTGVDAAITEVVSMDWKRGSDAVPTQLGSDGAFLEESYAKEHDLDVGSMLRLTTETGATLRLTVEGIFEQPRGGSPFGQVTVSKETFDRSFASHGNAYTFLNARGGVTPQNTARLEAALAAFPNVDVQTRDDFKAAQLDALDTVLNVVYALLALSVVVSLLGIVNTLVLSVFERTRELGMLRAIGMSRRQVRRMIRHESIVTTLIGATLGMTVGLLIAAVFTGALADKGFVFAVPYGSLVVFVLAAIALGFLAAVLPARRASRLNVLHALQYE